MFEMPKTLIVVYKDEMLVNQLKKLVQTNDDINESRIVGTRDDSINIVAWTEKVWLENKKTGNINSKVLFLGDIKDTDKLIPVVDVKFDDCGVRYGWAGNQAVLYTDLKAVGSREAYLAFIKKLSELPVPEMIKQPQNATLGGAESVNEEAIIEPDVEGEKKKTPAFLLKARDGILKGADAVGKAGAKLADKTGDLLRDKNVVRRQMMFYGVVNLYRNGLEEFMNV